MTAQRRSLAAARRRPVSALVSTLSAATAAWLALSGLALSGPANAQVFTRGNQLLDAAPQDYHCGEQITAGDFDGDGLADLAMGIPQGTVDGIADAGLVRVWSGSTAGLAGPVEFHQGQDSVPGIPEAGDNFGSDVADGDFNGDGFDDLAVAVAAEDISHDGNPVIDGGVVEVLYGSSSGLTGAGSQLWSQESSGISGDAEEGDLFGQLTTGDLNDDGYSDLVIGAPYEDIGAVADAGGVWVIFGSAAGLVATGSVLFDESDLGSPVAQFRHLGGVVRAGDFDGDGSGDVALGVPGATVNGHPSAGLVWVASGSPAGLAFPATLIHQGIVLGSGAVVGAAEDGDGFGTSLAIGDFDRATPQSPHYFDLAIGAEGEDSGHGAVVVIPGGPGGLDGADSLLFSEDQLPGGSPSPYHFGKTLSAGPLHSSFRGDLVVGAALELVNGVSGAGRISIVPGSSGGLVLAQATVLDASVAGLAIGGPTTNLSFGLSLATGNFDGRGVRDLVVGVPGYGPVNGQGRHPGGVEILYSALFAADFATGELSQWSTNVP